MENKTNKTMKTAREILLPTLIKNKCYWEDMDNLTNAPVKFVIQAMEEYAQSQIEEKDDEIKRLNENHLQSLIFISNLGLEKSEVESELVKVKAENERARELLKETVEALEFVVEHRGLALTFIVTNAVQKTIDKVKCENVDQVESKETHKGYYDCKKETGSC